MDFYNFGKFSGLSFSYRNVIWALIPAFFFKVSDAEIRKGTVDSGVNMLETVVRQICFYCLYFVLVLVFAIISISVYFD